MFTIQLLIFTFAVLRTGAGPLSMTYARALAVQFSYPVMVDFSITAMPV
jgi:F0F1-type ATP synthase assembly protein I